MGGTTVAGAAGITPALEETPLLSLNLSGEGPGQGCPQPPLCPPSGHPPCELQGPAHGVARRTHVGGPAAPAPASGERLSHLLPVQVCPTVVLPLADIPHSLLLHEKLCTLLMVPGEASHPREDPTIPGALAWRLVLAQGLSALGLHRARPVRGSAPAAVASEVGIRGAGF